VKAAIFTSRRDKTLKAIELFGRQVLPRMRAL
jgi:hypothetical protein